MRIVIDLQGAQSESRFRGIGRYSLSFAKALAKVGKGHEIFVAFSDLFPETIGPLRSEFQGLLPRENILVWSALGPVRACQESNIKRLRAAQLTREAYFAQFKPDFVHICSLFEGFLDDAVTSIGLLDTKTPVSVTLHDLIPFVHKDIYLNSSDIHRKHYLSKINFLRESSLIFAVSQYSLDEAVFHLHLPRKLFTVIYEAADERFRPLYIETRDAESFLARCNIRKSFVLYCGGYDRRKNLSRLITAFSLLPFSLRENHQLVFAGKISREHLQELHEAARNAGLKPSDLVFLGHVSDHDLVKLYNLCSLFVFPSWHEGFGLPVLEAMACGAVVAASDRSSIPEVVGRTDALFDPMDVHSIKAVLERGLRDEEFRQEMRCYGLERAKGFSWNNAARLALEAWDQHLKEHTRPSAAIFISEQRPKLAYLSPLPPERSGISDYSLELLPVLGQYYDVELILSPTNPGISEEWILNEYPVRDVGYFVEHAWTYQRVLYHIGNSPFHAHMFQLLQKIPGVVVLHDFFLSGVHAHMEAHGLQPHEWTRNLYQSHGYSAVCDRFRSEDPLPVIWKYPCNLSVLQHALGVIVHSEFSRQLGRAWYGDGAVDAWVVIPHPRTHVPEVQRAQCRKALGIKPEDFLVCSFGLLDPVKLNHKLLEAWIISRLAKDPGSRLIFVGENHGGAYGAQLLKTIQEKGLKERVSITGWVDRNTFRRYLAAADAAVQLRSHSRGETSGTVLDCMNYGVPTVVNAHGSMAELPRDAVWMLEDSFDTRELAAALEGIYENPGYRQELSEKARRYIATRHSPEVCAQAYFSAVETFSEEADRTLPGLVQSLARSGVLGDSSVSSLELAAVLARSFPPHPRHKQLLVDVSAIARRDLRTGIQRVTRAVLRELLENPPRGWRIEPVFADGERDGYRSARKFTAQFMGLPDAWAEDEVVDAYPGDVFFGLDFHHSIPVAQERHLLRWKNHGVRVVFLVYDLLPILMPQHFPAGNDQTHERWLQTVVKMDGAVCISEAVAEELTNWMLRSAQDGRKCQFLISSCPLGADIENTRPTSGIPLHGAELLRSLQGIPTFLMVGTIEPRKGHLQAVQALEQLWAEGFEVTLVIVGQEGWKDLPLAERRTIPRIVKVLEHHPERGKRLFWLQGVSDEFLATLYKNASCLLMASEGEGFGLPLVEAAEHGLAIIARDIPVFREIAGKHAFYFPNDLSPATLADALKVWLGLYQRGLHPRSHSVKRRTWKECVEHLVRILLDPEGLAVEASPKF